MKIMIKENKKDYYITKEGKVLRGLKYIVGGLRQYYGNSFATREEAELVVRKQKAWQRLKNHGFAFYGYTALGAGEIHFMLDWEDIDEEQLKEDMDLLFGVGDTNVTKIGGEE